MRTYLTRIAVNCNISLEVSRIQASSNHIKLRFRCLNVPFWYAYTTLLRILQIHNKNSSFIVFLGYSPRQAASNVAKLVRQGDKQPPHKPNHHAANSASHCSYIQLTAKFSASVGSTLPPTSTTKSASARLSVSSRWDKCISIQSATLMRRCNTLRKATIMP